MKIQMSSILLGIILAWIVAAGLTFSGFFPPGSACAVRMTSLEVMVRTARYVRPPLIMPFGTLKFYAPFALGMLVAYLASIVESIRGLPLGS